jgi:hypothetical protein
LNEQAVYVNLLQQARKHWPMNSKD